MSLFYRPQAKQSWTEAEEEEIRMLVVEYRQKEIQEGICINFPALIFVIS